MRSGGFAFAIVLSLAMGGGSVLAADLFGGGATLDPRFCKEHNLRQTVVYIDDSILIAGDVTWASTIYDKLAASLVPGERTTLVELSPVTGDSTEVWSGCWPAYTDAERKKLLSQSHFFSGDPLGDLSKQQKLFRYLFGVGAEKIEKKGSRPAAVVGIDPTQPPMKSMLRALVSDGARYARTQETIRAILYSDLAENSDLGSVFKPLPNPPENYGVKLGTTLRRSVFYEFGLGDDIKGDSSVKDSIQQFWSNAFRSMAVDIGGLGSDLSVPNVIPSAAYPYEVSMNFSGQKTVGRLSLLTDADGTLVDSWVGIVRLRAAAINGTYRCTGSADAQSCTLSATTTGGIVSDAPSETLTMSSSSSQALSGTIGIPGSSLNFALVATPSTD